MKNSKLYFIDDEPSFFCPGCGYEHQVNVVKPNRSHTALWKYNGDQIKPTFTPSVLVSPDNKAARCHSFVENGNIRYLNDCHHALAGKTVPLPDAIDWWT